MSFFSLSFHSHSELNKCCANNALSMLPFGYTILFWNRHKYKHKHTQKHELGCCVVRLIALQSVINNFITLQAQHNAITILVGIFFINVFFFRWFGQNKWML